MAGVPAQPDEARRATVPSGAGAGWARLGAGLLACLAVLVGCGDVPEPAGYRASGAVAGPAITNAGGEAGGSTMPEGLPAAAQDAQVKAGTNHLLLATPQGVLLVTAGKVEPVDGPAGRWPVAAAFDDALGGLVLQRGTADNPERPGPILWLPAGDADPTTILADGSRLLDVGFAEGSPYLVVLRPSPTVDRIRLADRSLTTLERLAPGQTLLALSAGGDRQALAVGDALCGGIQIRAVTDGALLDLKTAPPPAYCPVPRLPSHRLVALSPDGRSLAYTTVSYRSDGIETATELVVVDLDTGVDRRRVVGRDGDRILSLAFDGRHVVYLRRAAAGSTAVAVLDPATEQGERLVAVPADRTVTAVSMARRAVG